MTKELAQLAELPNFKTSYSKQQKQQHGQYLS
jgi:hypothetical protein